MKSSLGNETGEKQPDHPQRHPHSHVFSSNEKRGSTPLFDQQKRGATPPFRRTPVRCGDDGTRVSTPQWAGSRFDRYSLFVIRHSWRGRRV